MGSTESAQAAVVTLHEQTVCRHLMSHSVAPHEISKAASLYQVNGWFLVRCVVTTSTCDALHNHCIANEDVFRAVDYNSRSPCGRKFSLSSGIFWDCDAWWQLLENQCLLAMVEFCVGDGWNRWHLTKCGGDTVLGHMPADQELHSDPAGGLQVWYRERYGLQNHRRPAAVHVSLAVHDIHPDQGPMRISDWGGTSRWRRGCEPHVRSLPCPKGWVVVRDIRVVHSGTANNTSVDRWLPGYLACSNLMMCEGYEDGSAYRPARTLPAWLWEAAHRRDSPIRHRLDYMYKCD